ncbi:MAG: hypothetical protein IJI57_02630 [Flexilinea sp.]|nr:hypothetical protein [Flexilinea sp.]
MKLLISHTQILTPSDNKTNIDIPFRLRQSFPALFIRTKYDPKIVTDENLSRQQIEAGIKRYIPENAREQWGQWEDYMPVLNFVTLSLDYEEEYVGCAHRHSPVQDHIISENYSSPGFFRHAILPGRWNCSLNCHAIVDQTVTYTLELYGAEENEELHDHIQAF